MYKYINHRLIIKARNPIFSNGMVYSNPSVSTLEKLGYKKLLIKLKPDTKEKLYPYYIDKGVYIIQEWR